MVFVGKGGRVTGKVLEVSWGKVGFSRVIEYGYKFTEVSGPIFELFQSLYKHE